MTVRARLAKPSSTMPISRMVAKLESMPLGAGAAAAWVGAAAPGAAGGCLVWCWAAAAKSGEAAARAAAS